MVREVLASYSVPACFDLNGWTLDATRSFLHSRLKAYWLTQSLIPLPQQEPQRDDLPELPQHDSDAVASGEESCSDVEGEGESE